MDSFTSLCKSEIDDAWELRKQRKLRSMYIHDRPMYLRLLKHFKDSGMQTPETDRQGYLIDYRIAHRAHINATNRYHRALRKDKAEKKKIRDILSTASVGELRSALELKESREPE